MTFSDTHNVERADIAEAILAASLLSAYRLHSRNIAAADWEGLDIRIEFPIKRNFWQRWRDRWGALVDCYRVFSLLWRKDRRCL
jgi:hypothetical protein